MPDTAVPYPSATIPIPAPQSPAIARLGLARLCLRCAAPFQAGPSRNAAPPRQASPSQDPAETHLATPTPVSALLISAIATRRWAVPRQGCTGLRLATPQRHQASPLPGKTEPERDIALPLRAARRRRRAAPSHAIAYAVRIET